MMEVMLPRLVALTCLLFLKVELLESCPTSICSCSARATVICSNKRLERIPFFAQEDGRIYEEIDLGKNDIFAIPPYAFENVKTRGILLDENPLIGISPRAFDKLEDVLMKLDLSKTRLHVIHWGVFRGLRELRELNLGKNGLFAIPQGLFDGLENLQNLTLNENKLTSLRSGSLRGLKNLKKLDLAGNFISSIEPGTFEDCHLLSTLLLNSNQLRILNPISFRGLENVQRLSLDNNFIREIPQTAFFMLRNVKYFQMTHNNLTELDGKTFAGASRMIEIWLSANEISNVTGDTFSGMARLRVIRLDDNRLQSLGDDCLMHGLNDVVELNLSENPIDCFCSMSWIKALVGRGVKVSGECRRPEVNRGTSIAIYNFTGCNASECKHGSSSPAPPTPSSTVGPSASD